jgi:effector-binding domain-containing protein
MKTLRRILFALLIIIILIIGIGFLLPRHVHVERSLMIKAPAELIFEQVNSFRNWNNWSPWHQMDTNMQAVYSGPEEGSGAKLAYHSDNKSVGEGRLTITTSIPYDSIVLDMDFMENGRATSKFTFTKADSGTLVKWMMESDLKNNPISRWFGLFMDNMVGKDFEEGLAKLNEFSTAAALNSGPGIVEKDVPAQIILSIRDTVSPSTIGTKIGIFYGRISKMINNKKLTVTGAPFAIYYSYSPALFDMEAGLPVNEVIESTKDIKCREIPAQKTVMSSFMGAYEKTAKVYEAIERYIKDKKMTIAGSPWEVYITDPQLEPDTSKWQTDIYYPVK